MFLPLVYTSRVCHGLESSIATLERLRAGAHRAKNLRVRNRSTTAQPGEEVFNVAAVIADLLRWEERIYRHLVVLALVNLPVLASNSRHLPDCGLAIGSIRVGNGTSASNLSQPDHNLKLEVAGWRIGREDVIRHIGDESIPGVGPLPGRRDGTYVTQSLWCRIDHCVRVALHLLWVALYEDESLSFVIQ